MADKIMILTSSPRKHGNTNTVTQWVIEGARAAGAKVACVDVANLKHKFNGIRTEVKNLVMNFRRSIAVRSTDQNNE